MHASILIANAARCCDRAGWEFEGSRLRSFIADGAHALDDEEHRAACLRALWTAQIWITNEYPDWTLRRCAQWTRDGILGARAAIWCAIKAVRAQYQEGE